MSAICNARPQPEILSKAALIIYIGAMSAATKPLPISDTITPPESDEVSAEVRDWQIEKIKAGLKAADEGRFASSEAVQAVIR
ncbi:hypothetical protein BL756_005418, partial [Escherichia coli]|nr:hypothetical protein [Escherichia coli]